MASKDLGLIPYLLVCTIVLLILTTVLLRAYTHISVPNHAKIIVWLSWTLCFSIVYILPLDLRPHVGDHSAMKPFYAILYWFCFFLTWILTPFQSAYIKSGGFSTKERLFDAVKLNVIFFIVIGIVGVIAFVYLWLATNYPADYLGAVLQAFGNLWGLSFAIMTMGYGLVEIPRYFWYKSNYDKRLQYLYFKVSQLQEEKENSRDRVDELLYLYRKSKSKYQSQFVYEFAKIDEIIPSSELEKITGNNRIAHPDVTFDDIDNIIDCDDFKRKHLVKIHMLFKIWLFQLERTNAMFQKTMADIFYFEGMAQINNEYNISNSSLSNIDANTKNGDEEQDDDEDSMVIEIQNRNNRELDKLPFFTKLYYKFEIRGMPIVSKSMAILLSILSIMIIWSEAMIIFDAFDVKPYLSVFALINNSLDADISIVFGVILFSYLSSCSLFALWRIHINKDYHMHPFQLTDSGSILTNCAFSMRFMFPLGYNFLLLNISKDQRSGEEDKEQYPYLALFHDMSVLPVIGDPVNVFLPMLVIVFCIATWFNVYGKLMKKLRISRFEFGDPKSAANEEIRVCINEGKTMTRRFKKQLNNDYDKKQQFRSYISHRFQNKTLASNANSVDSNNSDLVNVSLMNQNQQQHIMKSKKNNNKHQFVELQHSNLND